MNDQELTVNLKDMLAYCFLHWRSAIVVVLCGALLGVGYSAYRASLSAPVPAAISETGEVLAEGTALEDLVGKAINEQYANLAERCTYYESSPLMAINPNEVHVARATIVIEVDGTLRSSLLGTAVAAYKNSLWAGESVHALAQEKGTTLSLMSELAKITIPGELSGDYAALRSSDQTLGQEVSIGQVPDYSDATSATLTLEAIGETDEDAVALRDALLEDLTTTHGRLAATVGEHGFDVVDMSVSTQVDVKLLEAQTNLANSISTARNTISTNERNLGTYSTSGGDVPADAPGLRSLAKRGAVGGVGAFLLYGFVLCLRYLLGARPEVAGQVAARYGLPDIGSYAYGDAKFYRHNTGFDRWLRKVMGMRDAADADVAAEMIAANVRLYAGEAKSLLLASSVGSEHTSELAGRLSELLDGCSVACAGDLVGSASARGLLKSADAVVLVEEYGKSEFTSIDSELELLSETGKLPLGIVMA